MPAPIPLGPGRALPPFYFAFFGVTYLWTWTARYLETLGWGPNEAGLVLGACAVAQSIALILWSRAGRTRPDRVVRIQTALAAVAALALILAPSPWPAALALLAIAVTRDAALPLVDAIALAQTGAERYGAIRSWGTAGFLALAAASAWLGLGGADYASIARLLPWGIAAAIGAALLASLGLSAPLARDPSPESAPSPLFAGRTEARRAALLLALGALHWAAQAPFNLFLVRLCESRSFEAWVPGAATVSAVAAEYAFLRFIAPRLLAGRRTDRLLAASFAAGSARWALTALPLPPAALIAFQIAHALSFALFLAATVAALNRCVHPSRRAEGQALFYVAVFGAGSALGTSAAGALIERLGAPAAFWGAAALELSLAALTLVWFQRRPSPRGAADDTAADT